MTTPAAGLRERITAALLEVWMQRAAAHTAASPHEHCAALAAAALEAIRADDPPPEVPA